MAFVRPIVYVYQQFQNVTVAPGTPDLNCCIVGPAYNILDYPADKTTIELVDFIAAGETADAPCDANGNSLGRPPAGTDFVTISDTSRPGHIAGAVLDDSSVQVIFDDLYIQVGNGADGAIADNDYLFTDTTSGDFSGYDAAGNAVNASGTQKVAAGDRIVLTKTPGGASATTVVKQVAYVVSDTVVALSSTLKESEGSGGTGVGNADIKWRVEHQLDDQQIDTAYYAIAAGDVTIKTGAFGILLTYESLTWAVNYAKMYLGYRELRVDLDDVTVINSIDDVTAGSGALIGRIDERNPLAAAVQVALANTGNPIQVFGVATDDLTGHQSARDRMTSRSDIYAIVPVTGALSGSAWINIIDMWKKHCVAFAAFDVGKFRVTLGSYDILPTEKASAPASLEGYTTLDPVNTTLHDVMVDPAASTDFEVAEVDSTHLLDLMHGTTMKTVVANSHIFTDTYAAKELLGVIGGKRLRTTAADKFASAVSPESNGYIVRSPYLKSEGGSGYTEDVDAITWADNGGKARIGKTGAFANVTVGDVAKVSGGDTAGNNGGWLVTAVNVDYIDIELTYAADIYSGQPGFACQVYRCVTGGYVADADITGGNTFSDQAAGSSFANALVGDVILCWDSATPANKGMWVITNKTDDNNVVVGTPATLTNDGTNATVVSLLRIPYKAINANASLTARRRLTRLRDDTASFTTTVEAGEDINIPYPADVDPTKWDTATTQWPIETVVNDNMLDAQLGDLEELAPELFVAGFDGDMPYRISIDLNPDSQVVELNSIITPIASSRLVMTWPNSLYVSNLENELTGVQNKQSGQYLACAVGGMVAGLPSHQGFTYIGIGGIQQIFNSNFYFTESQLTDLRDGGWYVFKQDTSSSLPYVIHEVTTDVSAYDFGEFMNVKNFDYIALYMKEVLDQFLGQYNITPETIEMIKASLNAAAAYLKLRIFPKIGVPLLSSDITYIAQSEDEVDRIEVYMDIKMPTVLNRIGLHLVA